MPSALQVAYTDWLGAVDGSGDKTGFVAQMAYPLQNARRAVFYSDASLVRKLACYPAWEGKSNPFVVEQVLQGA